MADADFINYDCDLDGHQFEMGTTTCLVPGCTATEPAAALPPPPKFDRQSAPQMGGEPPEETIDPLVVFLYRLLRDHIHPGTLEDLTTEIEYVIDVGTPTTLTNRYLAGYAENIARRINGD